MANWNRNKVDPSLINGGKEFTADDDLAVNELNAMVNNSFYGVDFVEAMADAPDISEIAGDGTPSVSLVPNGEFMKFKFSNLKGERGEQGVRGEKGEKGESGESNSLFQYIGSLYVEDMDIEDFFSSISSTFGVSKVVYYIVPQRNAISSDKVVFTFNSNVQGSIVNKWLGVSKPLSELGITKIETNSSIGDIDWGQGSGYNGSPVTFCDHVEISRSETSGHTEYYNIHMSCGAYDINIGTKYGSVKISSKDIGGFATYLRVYGVVV